MFRAVQSDRVAVFVGESSEAFFFPAGLLRHSKILYELSRQSPLRQLSLPAVSEKIFGIFFDWSFHNHLPDDMSLELAIDALELTIRYKIFVLQNHLADKLREKLLRGDWALTPAVVEQVYRITDSDTAIRRLFAMALCTLPGKTPAKKGKSLPRAMAKRQQWRDLGLTLPELGADWIFMSQAEDAEREFRHAEACEFHDHGPYEGGGCLTAGRLWRSLDALHVPIPVSTPPPTLMRTLSSNPAPSRPLPNKGAKEKVDVPVQDREPESASRDPPTQRSTGSWSACVETPGTSAQSSPAPSQANIEDDTYFFSWGRAKTEATIMTSD